MEQKRWWREPGLVLYVAGCVFYLVLSLVHGDPEPDMIIGFALGIGGGWLIGFLLAGDVRQRFPPIAAAIRGERTWASVETSGMLAAFALLAVILVAMFPNDAAAAAGTLLAVPIGNRKRVGLGTRF